MRMYEPKFAGRNTLRRKKVFVPHGMYSIHFFLASPSIVQMGFISKSKTIKPIFPICMKTSRPHDARCIPKLWCRCSHCSKAVYQPYTTTKLGRFSAMHLLSILSSQGSGVRIPYRKYVLSICVTRSKMHHCCFQFASQVCFVIACPQPNVGMA